MRIIETKVYKYEELSDDAKAKARDWFRNASAGDTFFAEHVTDEFHETLKAFGFDVDEKRGLSWSGFWSQGDGAAFTGKWYASQFAPGKLLADRPIEWADNHAAKRVTSKENVELHRIAAELRECKKAGVTFALIDNHYRGFHMRLAECEWGDEETPQDATKAQLDGVEARLIEAARDLAHGFYKALEAEYEYQNSDEQVSESIIANEYEFTEEGERA